MVGRDTPLVSVIVPAYNAATWLEECLNSISGQTLDDFECIVIDDGSADATPQLVDAFAETDARFKVVHQGNRGLSGARNEGILRASGAYLTFVDSDDCMEPTMLEQLVRALEEQGTSISMCDYAEVTATQAAARGVFDGVAGKTIDERRFWLGCYGKGKGSCIFSWGKLYKKELFEHVCFPEGFIYEDQIIALDLFSGNGPISIVRDALYHYRIHKGGLTYRNDTASFIRASEAFLQRDEYFAEKGWPDVRVGNLHKLVSYLSIIYRTVQHDASGPFKARYVELRKQAQGICRKIMPSLLACPSSALRILPFMISDKLHIALHDAWHRRRG